MPLAPIFGKLYVLSHTVIHPGQPADKFSVYPQKINLKALCHYIRRNCFLMSSLVQKFNQRGPRKYGHAQYLGIVHGSTRTFAEIERLQREDVWHCLRLSSCEPSKLQLWAAKRVRIPVSKLRCIKACLLFMLQLTL